MLMIDARRAMLNLLAARGVPEARVLDSMAAIPRERFVSADDSGPGICAIL